MSRVISVISFVLVVAGLIYAKWRLTPPKNVIGSYLDDTDHNARMLIRLSREQGYDQFDNFI